MRRHTALIGFTLFLLTVAARAYGSGIQAVPAQAAIVPVSFMASVAATSSPVFGWTFPAGAGSASPVPSKRVLSTELRRGTSQQGESTATTVTAAASPEPSTPSPFPATATPSPLPPTATPSPATPTATSSPRPKPRIAMPAPTKTPCPDPAVAPELKAPDRLVAHTIGLDTPVIAVGWHPVTREDGTADLEWDVASYVAGWHQTSAKPGEVGNTVIAGHSDALGEIFRDLQNLQAGDLITLYAQEREFKYVVSDKFVVQEKDATFEQRLENGKWIGRFPDKRLTLFTCWPPNDNTHRIFVIAKPTE